MTIKQRYDSAVGLLRLLRHDSRASCDVVFASPSWKFRHAAHAHVLRLASTKLAQDLDGLRRAAAAENNINTDGDQRSNEEVVIDVPDDVSEEGKNRFLSLGDLSGKMKNRIFDVLAQNFKIMSY